MRKLLRRSAVASAIASIAVVPSGAIATSGFTDVPSGMYYTDAVEWAYENGVTTGTSATTFSPGQSVSRGQMVTFLERYEKNVAQKAPWATAMTGYSIGEEVTSYDGDPIYLDAYLHADSPGFAHITFHVHVVRNPDRPMFTTGLSQLGAYVSGPGVEYNSLNQPLGLSDQAVFDTENSYHGVMTASHVVPIDAGTHEWVLTVQGNPSLYQDGSARLTSRTVQVEYVPYVIGVESP